MPEEHKQRILIVDDMPTNIKIIGDALRADYAIMVARDGEKALQIAKEQTPDLILLDIMMPVMDGYAVCRQLKADNATKNIPVIFITAKNQSEDELQGLELGAVDYITKPFHLPVVKARVRTQLDLRRKYLLLESIAALDGLTEIPNRRRFDESLDIEWRRAQRDGKPLTVIFMDIDFFKNFNDAYGHTAGDDCLKRVAKVMADCVHRGGDLVARYGGEEFVALLPDTPCDSGLVLAEKIRVGIEALNIPHAHSSVAPCVTLSLGVATAFPNNALTPGLLVETADKMLYKAKQQGRNQIKFILINTQNTSSNGAGAPAA